MLKLFLLNKCCSLPKFYFCRLDQCFGSGSGWIRVFSPIRIQTLINPDPSVFCFNLPLNYQRKLELIFNLCVILFALLLCFSTNYWGLNVLWLCFRGTWPKKNSVEIENAKDDIKFVYLYLQFIGFFFMDPDPNFPDRKYVSCQLWSRFWDIQFFKIYKKKLYHKVTRPVNKLCA